MKIPVKESTYAQVMALPRPRHHMPKRPGLLFRLLMRAAARKDLKETHFTYTSDPLTAEEAGPCLILMNHSSWIDLLMVTEIFKDRPYCTVCTGDGFVGKRYLMEQMGCIPTQKFVTDFTLLTDIAYALKNAGAACLCTRRPAIPLTAGPRPCPGAWGCC